MSDVKSAMHALGIADRKITFGRHAGEMLSDLSKGYLTWIADQSKSSSHRDFAAFATDARAILASIATAHAVLAGAVEPPRNANAYVIERRGDIAGVTLHDSLDGALAALATEYPIDPETGARSTPDPEDDRILIWEVLPSGHRKVVWHFSGWHWDAEEFGLDQGALPGDNLPLYAIALAD
jgi:hypothetical protein